MKEPAPRPWYREPGPWLLMAGPAVVVVASMVTLWLALRSSDGLVAEDYYRRGLAINRTLAQSERASELGLGARIGLSGEQLSVRLQARSAAFAAPARLLVQVSHPTRAGVDQRLLLPLQDGAYRGPLHLPAEGHWLLQLEDEEGSWRLAGNLILPASGETVLGTPEAAKTAF